uniref:Uncharacterized protein n=1 Tax=Panagrellus redivivus TaxID=6233 RepID=A0A7E4ZU45_PANRE
MMKLFLLALCFGVASAKQPLDDICTENFADLNICKLRGVLARAYDELNEIIGTYQDMAYAYHSGESSKDSAEANFLFEKVQSDRINALRTQRAHVARGPMEKRKSAFVRFGKRSELAEPIAQIFPSNPNAASDNVPEAREVAKRKSSYVRFG